MNPQEPLLLSLIKQQQAKSQAVNNGAATAQLDKMLKVMRNNISEMNALSGQPATSHAKELTDKDLEIQSLKTQLAASQEENTKKTMKLLEQYAKELNDKNLVIGDLETRLSAAEQQTIDQLRVLREQHTKEIKNKALEIQTLQDKLAAGQEQHAKELNDKDLEVQELKAYLPAAELQTVDKVKELTNENKRLSVRIHKLEEEERIRAERYLPFGSVMKQLQAQQKASKLVPQPNLPIAEVQKERGFLTERRLQSVSKAQEALRQVYNPTKALYQSRQEPTSQLHTELGKLYMELQEAKKPQEALMALLAAKDKEIWYLMEQHRGKLAAKDSEIQNLKEMIQGGEEMNAAMADGQSE